MNLSNDDINNKKVPLTPGFLCHIVKTIVYKQRVCDITKDHAFWCTSIDICLTMSVTASTLTAALSICSNCL